MRRVVFFLLFSVPVLLTGCGKEGQCDVPFGDAACSINLLESQYYPLGSRVGGCINLVGGHKGICVVHTGMNEYAAFERACPIDHETAVEFVEGSDGVLVRCPVCGSQFCTYTDGTPMEGSVTSCSLYQYGTTLEGTILHIY